MAMANTNTRARIRVAPCSSRRRKSRAPAQPVKVHRQTVLGWAGLVGRHGRSPGMSDRRQVWSRPVVVSSLPCRWPGWVLDWRSGRTWPGPTILRGRILDVHTDGLDAAIVSSAAPTDRARPGVALACSGVRRAVDRVVIVAEERWCPPDDQVSTSRFVGLPRSVVHEVLVLVASRLRDGVGLAYGYAGRSDLEGRSTWGGLAAPSPFIGGIRQLLQTLAEV